MAHKAALIKKWFFDQEESGKELKLLYFFLILVIPIKHNVNDTFD